jgi:hypothetical protein
MAGGLYAAGMPNLFFHDLRRSGVRSMERAGVPRKVAMSITGRLTESMNRRYDIVNDRDVRQAGRKMEQFFEQAGPSLGSADDTRKSS